MLHLGQLDFLTAKDNVVLLGPPGTGKTHLAIALGIRACLAGQRVAFATATEWVARLGDAQRQGRLDDELRKLLWTRCCWRRAPIWPRSARCTGCWPRTASSASAATSSRHPPYATPGAARRTSRTRSGRGTSRKLLGPAKWTYFYLYVILDVFSRYAVGWTVRTARAPQLAKALIAQAVERKQIEPTS